MHFEEWLLVSGILLFVSIISWILSNKFGIPALVLFLAVGMLAGSDGPGGIYFDNVFVAQSVGIVALAFILFGGGLETRWKLVRPALGAAVLLSTIGVMITTMIVAVFAQGLLRFSLVEGLLLGAIISATDAAAVFTVLNTKNLYLTGKIIPLLELESGSNDPMAVFLTIGLIELLVNPQANLLSIIVLCVQQMGIGTICGLALGWLSTRLLEYIKLDVVVLYAVLTIALTLITYGLTATLGGSGFLAVYLLGLMLGNKGSERLGQITRFHDAIAWLMQIIMFVLLGLLVFPSHLPSIIVNGLLLTGVVIFIARPLSVLIALLPVKMRLQEKLFVGWVGLRGAVPIVLATFPLLANVPQASLMFDLVFFIVVASVLLHGTTVVPVAKWLGVIIPPPEEH